MQLMLKLAEEHHCMDVYSEADLGAAVPLAIEERLSYLASHNIEQLKNLAKCELIRRKMAYRRISKFPPRSAYTLISERNTLFSIQVS